MNYLLLQMMFFFIKLGVAFVPEHKYTHAIMAIDPSEHKNDSFDLKGWKYQSVNASRPDCVHNYYYYPGPGPDAPVFLLLHGLNFDGRNFLNLRALASRYQLIAYDFPDQSPFYNGTSGDFSALLNDFLAQKHITRMSVLGVSFGGVAAVFWAARTPGITIDHLVLASSGISGTTEAQRNQSRSTAAWVAGLEDYQVYWVMKKLTNRFVKAFSAKDRKKLSPLFRIKHPDFYRQVVTATAGYNAAGDARRIDCPVLLLLGTRDEFFPVKKASSIMEFVPQAKIELVPNGTHVMTFLQGEDIAQRIDAFCRNADTRPLASAASIQPNMPARNTPDTVASPMPSLAQPATAAR